MRLTYVLKRTFNACFTNGKRTLHILLWRNGKQSKNSKWKYVSRELNQRHVAFQAGALDHWAMLKIEELWF